MLALVKIGIRHGVARNEYRSVVAQLADRSMSKLTDCMPAPVQGWLTHRDDALERGWQPEQRPLTGDRLWRLLPVDILTVAR